MGGWRARKDVKYGKRELGRVVDCFALRENYAAAPPGHPVRHRGTVAGADRRRHGHDRAVAGPAARRRADAGRRDPAAEAEIASVMRLVTEVRRFRSEEGLRPGQQVPAALTGLAGSALAGHEGSIRALLRLSAPGAEFRPTTSVVAENVTVELDTAGVIDVAADVARSLVTSGEWERYESRLFSTALEEGMVAVDIGANIGLYTLEAAQKVGSKGNVIAFEPEPHNFDLLCRNIEANHFRNVTPVRKALSNQRGVARLAISPDNLGAHHIETSPSAGDSVEVETLSLDEYFCGRSSRIDVIKIDAEGAEMSILGGMRGLLDANPHLILFTEFAPRAIRDSGYDPEEYLQELSALGFQLGIVDQKNTRIEALSVHQVPKLIGSLLREERGRFYVDLLCIRGRAIQGSLGPHAWWQRPALESVARAGRG